MSKERIPNLFLAVFTALILFTVFVFPRIASGEDKEKASKPPATSANKAELFANSNVCEVPEFCTTIGPCTHNEVKLCAGKGFHICATLGDTRYLCHDCNGEGECLKNKSCGNGAWWCEKLKGK